MEACIERMMKVSLQPRKGVENTMRHATNTLSKAILNEELEQNFPNPKALDEWVPHTEHQGRRSFIRAYGIKRLFHQMLREHSVAPNRRLLQTRLQPGRSCSPSGKCGLQLAILK